MDESECTGLAERKRFRERTISEVPQMRDRGPSFTKADAPGRISSKPSFGRSLSHMTPDEKDVHERKVSTVRERKPSLTQRAGSFVKLVSEAIIEPQFNLGDETFLKINGINIANTESEPELSRASSRADIKELVKPSEKRICLIIGVILLVTVSLVMGMYVESNYLKLFQTDECRKADHERGLLKYMQDSLYGIPINISATNQVPPPDHHKEEV